MHILCPHCRNPIELVAATAKEEILCSSCGSSFRLDSNSTADMSQVSGRTLGKFELLDTLGQGAFGTVYKARDPELDRTVAVKVPRSGHFAEPQELDRFVREARSAAQLQHPSIVTVHEVGTQDGLPYLVSDFVAGITLADFLTSRQLSFTDSAQLIVRLAEALEYAHERGVIHRDVKPSNVMLEQTGNREEGAALAAGASALSPRLMDFGLAKREAGEITMTIDGQVLGTPAYMSPEQAAGEAHRVDGRSDVYSLGAMLYQLLTGEVPFRGNKRMLLWQVLHEEPRPPRKLNDRIPRDLETICLKALAKEPGRRYQTAGALADDLRRFLKKEPIQARPVGRLERAVKWARRRPALAGLWGVIVLATLGLLGGGLWFTLRLDEARAHAEGLARSEGVQRKDAEVKRTQAETARTAEEKARKEAERLQGLAEQRARELDEAAFRLAVSAGYAADDAWEVGRVVRANDLLDKIPPKYRGWEWRYRKRRFEGSYLTLRGHTARVRSVAFSPDGRRLGSLSEDGTVKVWDAATGKELLTLRGHTATSVAFSPDGQRLASAGGLDRTVKVWEGTSGKELLTLRGHSHPVLSVVFSPDGAKLFCQNDRRTTLAWDAKTGTRLPAPAEAVAFPAGTFARHPSRPILALAAGDRIELVDLSPPDAFKLCSRQARARLDPVWQEQQAQQHEKAQHWFAAAFHWGQLTQHKPASEPYWQGLERACAQLGDVRPALAVCDQLLARDATLAPIYLRRARLRANLLQFYEATADHLAGLALATRNPAAPPKKQP